MTDNDRYLLIFSLAIFFGLMALGLVSIKSSANMNAAFNNINNQLQALTTRNGANKVAGTCYSAEEFSVFQAEKQKEAAYIKFLTAQASNGNNLEVHLNASPRNNGLFYVVSTVQKEDGTTAKCVVMQGTDMKMAINRPGPDATSGAVMDSVVEAVEETSDQATEETVKAVKDVIEEGRETLEKGGEALDDMTENTQPAETGIDEYNTDKESAPASE